MTNTDLMGTLRSLQSIDPEWISQATVGSYKEFAYEVNKAVDSALARP